MNLELRARPKKAEKNDVVMEHFARADNPHTRRQAYGIQYRQQTHTVSNSFDKFNFNGSRGNSRNLQLPHHGQLHNCNTLTGCGCTCVKLFNEFCDRSTLHGLKYVGDKNLHFLERLFWAVAFILATITAGYFIGKVYNKWDETPVIVSIAATTTPLKEIPFPAVTVCTMNKARKSEAIRITNSKSEADKLYRKFLQETCSSDTSVESTQIQKHSNITSSWKKMLEFMVKVRQPCHEMVKVCYFAGERRVCSDIFNPSLTDEGICCTFNKVKRDYIYRNARNLSDLNMTFPMPTADWTPENGYPSNTTVDTLPWRALGVGVNLGLTLVLEAEAEQFHCSTSASVGFKLLLHNPVETPKIADVGSIIAPGREYRIKITPTIYNAARSLRNLKEAARKCSYSADRYLRFYRTYTEKHCSLECEANFTFNVCSCVPFYLPKDVETPICGKEEERCANLARKYLEMLILDEVTANATREWKHPDCHCLPGCNELSYSSSTTHANMDPSFVKTKGYVEETADLDKIGVSDGGVKRCRWFEGKSASVSLAKKYEIPKHLNPAMRNLAVVHLYFTHTQFLSYYKTELFGLSEFLSSTGGLLGLFIGFSFISAVEILYFATVRLWYGIAERRNNVVENYPFVK